MAYESITLQQEIQIDQIVSIHYFEYMSDFTFGGESHDFWEFLCVDKGVINVIADAKTYTLQKGDIIFHKPNEFHNVLANGIIAPNLVVIGFECSSDRMDFFRDKILQIGEAERSLLGLLIKEAHNTFASGLDDPYCEKLIRKEITPFGSEQFIKMYLQEILLRLIRTYSAEHVRMVLPKSTKQRSEDELFHKVISYMEENLSKHLTIEQICRDNLMGRSILQKLFREHTEYSVIDYFSSMKINMAKQLMREQHMNFTQISDFLGYNSIHYFSRQFKKTTGMTPSEYASSIKLLAEKNN
ncbi:MAG: AraC family transcriptional regulator [Lachnospiraceae bacterium]